MFTKIYTRCCERAAAKSHQRKYDISVVGSGYIGLVSGTMMALTGNRVTCYDNDAEKILELQKGNVRIYEPDLDKHVLSGLKSGHLRFEHISVKPVETTDAVFIAVPTPSLDTGETDLSYVRDAVSRVAENYRDGVLIVIKSTVPPGTCDSLEAGLRLKGRHHLIASNPEFLREGSAISDFLWPDRIVVGANDRRAFNLLDDIYFPITDEGSPILRSDRPTAELIKYASNSLLATKIAFANEMANLCEKIHADVDVVLKGVGLDRRIGKEFLRCGPGYGGSCFPKDTLSLSYLSKELNQPCHILDAVIFSNDNRRNHMVSRIEKEIGELRGKTIGVLGITFKADTDDTRSSPAVDIVNSLVSLGARVNVYDPKGMENARPLVPNASFVGDSYEAVERADCAVVLTEWKEFRRLNFERIKDSMSAPVVFDFRNLLDEGELKALGFSHFKIGK